MEADREEGGLQQVGIPEMDADHEDMLAMAHDLRDGLSRGLPTVAVLEQLDDLLAMALAHFDREERLMADAAYPRLDEHAQSHNRLLRAMLSFRDDVRHERYRIDLAVQFIHAWVVEHVRIEDVPLAAHLRTHLGVADARMGAPAAEPPRGRK